AIGGSVMHNLAINLKTAGHKITGSDDEIFEPSRSELVKHALLPERDGWSPEKIDSSIDAVILGMHAKADNPELLRAQQLNLKVYSFPEYIYNVSQDKQRIVIAGSHGKTTITAIIIHVLSFHKRKFDFVIGARVAGIDNSVKLSDAPIIIIEGDEYLSSAIDPVPKFLKYQHHIGLISGISWDHANVFPSEEEYVKQFDIFSDQTPKGGILIYCEQDPLAVIIGKKERNDVQAISYKAHPHAQEGGNFFLTNGKDRYLIKLFGTHNLLNINGAKEVLKKVGITNEQFYEAIASFEGAAGRLEKVFSNNSLDVYKDFAHAPSKVKATVKALKEYNPHKDLIACLELHTYSSLNKKFIPQYKDSLKHAQQAVVFYDPEKVTAKNQEPLSEADVKKAFGLPSLKVFTEPHKLQEYLLSQSWKNRNLLMMSSGNFGGMKIHELAQKLSA
ncbi:MAG TPA: Mur ligase family protein, partial [Cyclobacteriaceae bacterium]|nr:Mur ligase family protein [Cyclobacteriaceae bacterium]